MSITDGTLHVVSVSGGKDSAATSLYLKELGIPHRRVFADTGWELPEVYEYLRGPLTDVLGPIDEVRGPRQMEDLIRHKGMFPSRQRRYCTQLLKFEPIKAYLQKIMETENVEIVNAIGIRAEESAARATAVEREFDDGLDCEVWRPILRWTLDDVIAIHKRHGLAPNPLYLQGFTRVGCAPCIMSRKGEIKLLAERYPEQIERLRALETELKGRGRRGLAGQDPAWFQAPIPEIRREDCDRCGGVGVVPLTPEGAHAHVAVSALLATAAGMDVGEVVNPMPATSTCPACGGHGKRGDKVWPCWPIDKVVEWAKTDRGGRQFQLFERDTSRDGCLRWGLCDTAGEEEAPADSPTPRPAIGARVVGT